jgi:hypothetical protein
MRPYLQSKQSAYKEFRAWMAGAQSFFDSAAGKGFISYREIALSYLQLATEFGFKAVIVSLTGKTICSRNPHLLATRCRRLLPGLQAAVPLLSPAQRELFHFLDPAAYCTEREQEALLLPGPDEWKRLVLQVRKLLAAIDRLTRERIEYVYAKSNTPS